jgi:hypothetical protein
MHYIYGYPHRDDRDQHSKEHVIPRKRDSALSVGGTPPLMFAEHPNRSYGAEYNKQTSSPLYLPRPTANLQLAPLATSSQGKDHRDSLRSYSFVSEYPAGPRGSVDSEVDPLLPPLKRSRVGQSRLESIGELRLLRDIGPCLRCRVMQKPVSGHPIWHMFLADSLSATRTTLAGFVPTQRLHRVTTFGRRSAASEVRSLPLPILCCRVCIFLWPRTVGFLLNVVSLHGPQTHPDAHDITSRRSSQHERVPRKGVCRAARDCKNGQDPFRL